MKRVTSQTKATKNKIPWEDELKQKNTNKKTSQTKATKNKIQINASAIQSGLLFEIAIQSGPIQWMDGDKKSIQVGGWIITKKCGHPHPKQSHRSTVCAGRVLLDIPSVQKKGRHSICTAIKLHEKETDKTRTAGVRSSSAYFLYWKAVFPIAIMQSPTFTLPRHQYPTMPLPAATAKRTKVIVSETLWETAWKTACSSQ